MCSHQANAELAVCYVGNDGIKEWLIAAWESLRACDKDVPIYLLPFDNTCREIRKVAERYHVQFFEPRDLAEFERMVAPVFPHAPDRWMRCCRRLACFELPARHVYYTDADIVQLAAPSTLLTILKQHELDFMSFDVSMDFVYVDPALERRMTTEFNSKGFNAGAYLVRTDFLSRERFRERVGDALKVREGLAPSAPDQAFLNLCVDLQRGRHASLAEVAPEYCSKPWCGIGSPLRDAAGDWRMNAPAHPQWNGKLLPFYHWAGYKLDERLPHPELWEQYRFRSAPRWAKSANRVRWARGRLAHAAFRRLPNRLKSTFKFLGPASK